MESDSSAPEIQINIKGPSELKLQITIATDKTVRELKEAIAAKSDVEAERQRLIYSGRVLKDEDALAVYKIQAAHTIHMVKGVARGGAASGVPAASAAQLPTMQAGQNPTDPLTVLNGPMGHGALAGFNPFMDMGLNPNDPNMMQGALDNPAFLQQMSGLMSNPAVLDQIIASNPQLRGMGPQVREVFQSEQFRQMMSNPEALRSMLRMSAMMRDAGLGPGAGMGGGLGGMGNPFGALGGSGAGSSFPAPGLPSYSTPPPASGSPPQSQGTQAPFNPSMYPPFPSVPTATSPSSPGSAGGGAPAANPYAALAGLFGQIPPPVANPGVGAGAGANPFDPALMQSLIGGLGGMGGGAAATPADTRSPEERYQVQLQQLQDMGFTNAVQNVRALLATGGNVHAAIEYILSGGGV